MPVDFKTFNNVFSAFSANNASADQVTISSLEDGKIGLCKAKENSKIGFFARFFNRGSSASENKRTGMLLENVLSARYGQNTAFKAIKEVFGRETLRDGSRIGTMKIEQLLARAKELHTGSKISKNTDQSFREKFAHIRNTCLSEIGNVDAGLIEKLNTHENPDTSEALRKMLNALVNAHTVTDGFVSDSVSLEYLEAGIKSVKAQLEARFEKLQNFLEDTEPESLDAVMRAKNKCIKLMEERLEYSKQIANTNPVSLKELLTSASLHFEAAMHMFIEVHPGTDKTILDAYTKHKFKEDLVKFKPRLEQEITNAFNKNAKNPKEAFKIIKKLPERMAVHIQRAIAQTEGAPSIAKDDLVKMFSEHFTQILNMRKPLGDDNDYSSWKTLEKDIVFIDPGKSDLHFTSVTTPASNLNEVFKTRYGNLGGIVSHCSTEKMHAVNLARSELKNKDGKVFFSGIRHGVHSAYGIDDDDERRVANKARCEETVLAVLQQDGDLYERAVNGEEVEINITSLSLLSPWVLFKERDMLEDQNTAWNDIQRDGAKPTVNVNGEIKQLNIKVNVAKFNFAVHPIDVSSLRHVSHFSGWAKSRAMNREALSVLLDRYSSFCGMHGDDPAYSEKMAIAKKLKDQICSAIVDNDYGEGNGPYRIPARIAVLSYIMGDPPCWNCKSGKDRTAQLDVECKYLAAEIERTGDVPELNAKIDGDKRSNYIGMVLNSGNIEVQRYNVGVGGYKTKGDALFQRLQRPGAASFYSGASDAVGS